MKTNTEYKNIALAALKGHWAPAVLLTVIFLAIYLIAVGPMSYQTVKVQTYMQENMTAASSGSLSQVIRQAQAMAMDPEVLAMQAKSRGASGLYYLLYALIILPLTVGVANAFRLLVVHGDDQLPQNAYRLTTSNYWHKVWGMLLRTIFIWLWSLLFIVPGLIKVFSYALTPYILEEHPELTANEAIDRSRAMMRGHKFDLFWLYLSFIGWFFVCIFTFGIGFIWLIPYMQSADVAFYEDVKADYELHAGLI